MPRSPSSGRMVEEDRAGPSRMSGREQDDSRERRKDRGEEERRERKYRDRERSRSRSGERHRDRDGRDRDRHREKDEDKEARRKRRREREKESRTPSPSRVKRKEAKSLAKANARREVEADQARAVAELSMYSAVDNPFHDTNLSEAFVWKKKKDKEKRAGLTEDDIARKDARRRLEAKEELEKLNKRRADREVEMRLRDEEEQKLRRMAEDVSMREWVAKEDEFQLEQSRRRAGIRLREQRAKAIDFLAINLRFADVRTVGKHTAAIGALATARRGEVEREEEEEGWGWADAGFEFEMDEPWRIFENLNLEDCIELDQDIRMYLSLEKSPINIEFWEAMLQVCQHHLDLLQDPEHAEGGRLFDKEVDDAAGEVVSGLTIQRLIELENRTNAMLRSGQPVDGEFWDLVLKKIHVEKSISKLNSIHEIVLKNRLEQFKKRQREDAEKHEVELSAVVEETFGGDIHAGGEADDEADDEEDDEWEDYEPEMSPAPAEVGKLTLEERRLPIVSEEDWATSIFSKRREITSSDFIPRHVVPHQDAQAVEITTKSVSRPSAADIEAEKLYREEAEREKRELGSDESEEEFGDLDLDAGLAVAVSYDWSDRYRPRKPRFFNRVHTGFEWNQYNQTHYDVDNPPPKVVQGYKFNIFYPDLIDKTKAPTYYIKRIPGDEDTQLIVFTAGPPYEDIAFRIVRRPWEYSHRKGFRSTFDRGVLQLYFGFGRSFYRK